MGTLSNRISQLESKLESAHPVLLPSDELETDAANQLFHEWCQRAFCVVGFKHGHGPRPEFFDEGLERYWQTWLAEALPQDSPWASDANLLAVYVAMPRLDRIRDSGLSDVTIKMIAYLIVRQCRREFPKGGGQNESCEPYSKA
jgi:hypothetical protein